MAGKKSKKNSPAAQQMPHFGAEPAPLGMLQHLLSMIPDDEKLNFLSSMMGAAPDDDFLAARRKPRTRAQREVDRLVEEARDQATPDEALPLLIRAEAAARKALGKRFERLAGRLGDDPAGEMYLDVKLELAQALNAAGQREAALAHVEVAFRLDPQDPLGARLLLLAGYLDLERTDAADQLLRDECPEPWAAWLFGRLLVALRQGLRGKEADNPLKAAHSNNPFVLSLLLGSRMPDPTPPDAVETGEDNEAQEYAADFLPAWKNTPGAISWLRDAAARLNLAIDPPDEEGPLPQRLSAREYAELPPHRYAAWIVGLHEMPSSQSPGEDRPKKHWLIFAFSSDDDLIGFDLRNRRPSARDLWKGFVEFMLDDRQPGRPQRMLVHPATLVGRLKKEAARARIQLAANEHAEQLTGMLGQLTDRVQGGAKAAESLDPEAVRGAPLDVDEVWEAAVVQLEQRLAVAGHSLRPWVALVMSRGSGTILWHELFTDSPPEGALANALRMAIARPATGASRRPRQVVVRDHDEAVSLQGIADEAGFLCTTEAELPLIFDAVANLTQELLGGEPDVVLTRAAGITTPDLERFYTAAAAYFRVQPWKWFAMDEVIRLDRQDPPESRRFGLVMGQSGITLGLAVYERLADIKAMFELRSEQNSYESLSVMFGEDASVAPADLDAIEQFGWPVATPEAYPDVLRVHPGQRVETPTAEDIRFLTSALGAITWLAQHREEKTKTLIAPGITLQATRQGWVGAIEDGHS